MKEVSYSFSRKQEAMLTIKEPAGKHRVSEEAEGTRSWFHRKDGEVGQESFSAFRIGHIEEFW